MAFEVTLKVGQSTTVTIVPLEADGVTITPGAVVSAQTFTGGDANISLVTNADGTATVTALGATTGITVTGSCTVTQSTGASAPFTNTFTVIVTAPPPGTTSIGFQFSAPTP